MTDIQGQIEAIEKELRELPHHKATDHHIGRLRAKLSRLRDREVETTSRKSGGGGGYAVKKQGDATIVLVGPPSAGKSTLINRLTNAKSKVAPYAFTTVTVIPGMMTYKEAHIQILDVPGLIEGAEEGKGRGREVLSVCRGANLLVLMSDYKRKDALGRIAKALEKNGIRINKRPPHVTVVKKLSGGIIIHSNLKQDLDKETIQEIAQEFGIKNAEITLREKLDMERLIDAFSPSRVYIPTILILNKADTLSRKEIQELGGDYLTISAETGKGIVEFQNKVWEKLGFVRVFLVRPNQEPDYSNPIIMKKGQTLRDVANELGTNFSENITKAKIWGEGSKFPGQDVSFETPVVEGMQVRFL